MYCVPRVDTDTGDDDTSDEHEEKHKGQTGILFEIGDNQPTEEDKPKDGTKSDEKWIHIVILPKRL